MSGDWIDTIKRERGVGINRPLGQSQHATINACYPGLTLEYCCECDSPTGRAGLGEDSLYCEYHGEGPFCPICWRDHEKCCQD